jgi:hypothetical protein
MQAYSSNNTFVWTPTTTGDYRISVYVKDYSTTRVDASRQIGFSVR